MSVLPPERCSELLLLVLTRLPGLGPTRINSIIDRYGADLALLDADASAFSNLPGIGTPLAAEISKLLGNRIWRQEALDEAHDQLEKADRIGAIVLTVTDPRYPALLREIYAPPPILFVRGNPDAFSRPSIAVVGTRKATGYGEQAAELICRDLVLAGHTIVSGLAYGIDMIAHRTTLESSGSTIAVLGCGVDIIYTDRRGRIWPKILERGAIVSEEPIGQEPVPASFPKRNRLISGLSSGTLVVESDIKGGSMITASCALEQNREVFAVPGSIFSPNSRGTNRLIQLCQAKPVHTAADILSEISPATPARSNTQQQALPFPEELDKEESTIVEALDQEALMHIDLISEKTALSIDTLLVKLFELELKRVVVQQPGQLFRLRSVRSG